MRARARITEPRIEEEFCARAAVKVKRQTKRTGLYEREGSRSFGHENHKKELDFQIRLSFWTTSATTRGAVVAGRKSVPQKAARKPRRMTNVPMAEGNSAISIISVLTFNPANSEISKLDERLRAAWESPRREVHGAGPANMFAPR